MVSAAPTYASAGLFLHAGGRRAGSYDELLVNCNYSCICARAYTIVDLYTLLLYIQTTISYCGK